MRKSKIIFSILISLLFVSCRSVTEVVSVYENPLFDDGTNKHRVTITIPKAEITGIMITKFMEDEWRGSMINEFGIKAFDFTVNNNKCSIINTVSFLNKWYIRKTIESDLAFLFGNVSEYRQKKGKMLEINENGFVLINEKRKIKYNFYSIENV